jgi:uncharacterized protein (TIGR00266 family)
MNEWYFRYQGVRTGPYPLEKIREKAARRPQAEVFKDGWDDWRPIAEIAELGAAGLPSVMPANPAPAMEQPDERPLQRLRSGVSEGIDYRILGAEMQFVEVELDPQESVVSEAGAMMYKDASVEMETLFGDGSEQKGGFMNLLAGAGRRLITGESLFTTVFTHRGQGKAHVAFAAPYPGNIIPIEMPTVDGRLICQKDSFLCASKGISIGIHFQKKIMTGLFGGEGFILQKLETSGHDQYAVAFVHAGGSIIERTLQPGQSLEIDTGCLVAMTANIDFDIRYAGSIKSAIFGGEGLFFGVLRAGATPGRVWLQSLPFSRLAARMLASAPSSQGGGGQHRGEGSLLGGLGDLLNGDNR